LGIVIAAMAALLPVGSEPPWPTGCGAAGFRHAHRVRGHGLFELPVFTHLGLLFGANLATALAAGLSSNLAMTRVRAGWMRIGWRVAASWIGAILVLMLAFELTGAVS
jgi:hypothetical protein